MKFLDFFSGIGGFHTGLENAGMKCAGWCEFDKFAQDSYKAIVDNDPIRIRRLTPRECWRLQGFSDSQYEAAAAVNSNNQLYKQAGNAVTVNVVEEIGKHIMAINKELEEIEKDTSNNGI